MKRVIVLTFYFLTVLIPVIFLTSNYELFEFPKFLTLLSATIVILCAWIAHAVTTRDISIIPSSSPRWVRILHWSVLAVFVTQAVATIFSIHSYTSFWGYYNRFHQGLLTTICYTILYFAAVRWLDKRSTGRLISISLKTSLIVGAIAILEHFNISLTCLLMSALAKFSDAKNQLIFSTSCWGNMTNPLDRSFATIGQPNWLAAYLLPNLFFLLYELKKNKIYNFFSLRSFQLGILLTALVFTNSRSGFIAFILSIAVYWVVSIKRYPVKYYRKHLAGFLVSAAAVIILFGSPFSPALSKFKQKVIPPSPVQGGSTALETVGSTASGDIRKIVWTGALELIKKNPLLGTGPETFAYTYYWVRPVSHNYTTEADYLYNKAHNEYLNIAATSGLIGLAAYLFWHIAVFSTSFVKLPVTKKINKEKEFTLDNFLPVTSASITAFAVTNFFGFSIIPVYLLMILITAFTITLVKEEVEDSVTPFALNALVLLASAVLVIVFPARFALADYYYARGKAFLDANRPQEAITLLTQATKLRSSEDLFHSSLGEAYAQTATSGHNLELAVQEADLTAEHNKYHLNYYKSRTKIFISLSYLDPSYYKSAAQELVNARQLSPTDPKLAYNLGLIYSRLGDIANAELQMNQAIELKKNYQEPYYALTLIYEQNQELDKIPPLLLTATQNLSTYSAVLKEKIDKYKSK